MPHQRPVNPVIVKAENKIMSSLEVLPLKVERDLSEERYQLQKSALETAREGLDALNEIIASRKTRDAEKFKNELANPPDIDDFESCQNYLKREAKDSDVIAAVKVAVSAAEQQRPDLTLENENLLTLFTELTIGKFGDRLSQEEVDEWIDELTEAFTNSDNLMRSLG